MGQGEVGQGEVGQGEVGQGEVGGVTCRVTCTRWLLGLAVWFCVSRKGGWGHPLGDMHMVAAGLSCQSAMVGTAWTNSCPGCMNRL